MTAALLALTSALLFAFGVHFARLGLREINPRAAAALQIGTATFFYWLFSPLFVDAWFWLTWAAAMFAAVGILRPFASANLAMAGTKRLGPTVSSTLAGTSPLFGVVLGIAVLSEPLSWPVWLGAIGVMTGVAVLSARGGTVRQFPMWALALPVGAAALRAIAQLLTKVGLDTVPSPFFVALVGYSVAFVIAFATEGRTAGLKAALRTPGSGWLVAGGVINGVSVLVLNYALSSGRLSIVSPLVSCSPVFALLLGWLVFREGELRWRSVLGVVIVVPSVVLIAVLA